MADTTETQNLLQQIQHQQLPTFHTEPLITRNQIKEIIDNALGNNLTGALIVRELVKLL